MLSTKPYLMRGIYEWCVDQGFTPYIAARVDPRTRVPSGYTHEGQIVLNVGPEATHQLKIDNDQITFQARFNGVAHQIAVPINNVIAIYARENGQGMAFEETDVAQTTPEPPDSTAEGISQDEPPEPKPPRGSHLKIVK